MALAWIVLFLGSWVRLLTLSGLNFHHGATLLALSPLGLVALHHFAPGALRAPERSSVRWAMAGLTALFSVAFLRLTLLRFWDPAEALPTLLLALVGLGVALFASDESPQDCGPGPWLWVGLWMLLASRDPVLGILGAGLSPLLFHWGRGATTEVARPVGSPAMRWMLPLLLGLFLPRPWWDWGLQPAATLPLAAFGLGGGAASILCRAGTSPFSNRFRLLPAWALLVAIAVAGWLYSPSWGLTWGALLGFLAACAAVRLPKSLSIGAFASYWILGIVLSFALQANAWLPVLGHFIWLGE